MYTGTPSHFRVLLDTSYTQQSELLIASKPQFLHLLNGVVTASLWKAVVRCDCHREAAYFPEHSQRAAVVPAVGAPALSRSSTVTILPGRLALWEDPTHTGLGGPAQHRPQTKRKLVLIILLPLLAGQHAFHAGSQERAALVGFCVVLEIPSTETPPRHICLWEARVDFQRTLPCLHPLSDAHQFSYAVVREEGRVCLPSPPGPTSQAPQGPPQGHPALHGLCWLLGNHLFLGHRCKVKILLESPVLIGSCSLEVGLNKHSHHKCPLSVLSHRTPDLERLSSKREHSFGVWHFRGNWSVSDLCISLTPWSSGVGLL